MFVIHQLWWPILLQPKYSRLWNFYCVVILSSFDRSVRNRRENFCSEIRTRPQAFVFFCKEKKTYEFCPHSSVIKSRSYWAEIAVREFVSKLTTKVLLLQISEIFLRRSQFPKESLYLQLFKPTNKNFHLEFIKAHLTTTDLFHSKS